MAEEENPWMEFLGSVVWFLVLFGLVYGTITLLESWAIIHMPLGTRDIIIVVITVVGSIILIINLRNQWETSK